MKMNLYLHGGGTRVAAHLGAIAALEEAGCTIAAWSGASGGSLVSAVLAAGFTHAAAYELMLETDVRQFLDRRPLRMIRDYGLCTGRRFETWLDDLLRGARFASLDVPLSVVATDLATGEARLFSAQETPQMKIATAVRCSIGIPGIFGVRRIGKEMFVDGALSAVDPADLFPDETVPSAVVRLRRDRTSPLPRRDKLGLTAYIRRVMEIMLRCADDHCQPQRFTHDVCLDVKPAAALTFDMSPAEKQRLYDLGYQQARQHFCSRTKSLGETESPEDRRDSLRSKPRQSRPINVFDDLNLVATSVLGELPENVS